MHARIGPGRKRYVIFQLPVVLRRARVQVNRGAIALEAFRLRVQREGHINARTHNVHRYGNGTFREHGKQQFRRLGKRFPRLRADAIRHVHAANAIHLRNGANIRISWPSLIGIVQQNAAQPLPPELGQRILAGQIPMVIRILMRPVQIRLMNDSNHLTPPRACDTNPGKWACGGRTSPRG